MIRFKIQPEAKVLSYQRDEWLPMTPEAAQLIHRGEVTDAGTILFKVKPHRYVVKLKDVRIVYGRTSTSHNDKKRP